MVTTEAVEDLDLSAEDEANIICEVINSPRPTCAKDADWWLICRVCSLPIAACEKHRRWILKVIKLSHFVPVCLRCTNTGDALEDVYRVIPIGDL